ncbi:MAG: hypothetical protein NVV59_13375 [Chitinophagaceae bacterium]|nr:hypothetical protein [Chitinophagaceae bacterium]
MRRIIFLLGWGLFAGSLHAQVFTVDDLLGFTDFSSKRFDGYITKKGFVSSGHFLQSDSAIDTWDMIPPPTDSSKTFVHRRVSRFQSPRMIDFAYQTSSIAEAMATIKQMQSKGFTISDSNWNMQKPLLLQRKEWIVKAEVLKEDTLTYVELRWQKQHLPAAKKQFYVDDLLKFNSDEYLAAYFGRDNVRKDRFYFSAQEVNRCSVLFPNTPNQVVFVWDDNEAQKDILQIMVGAGMRTESVDGFDGVSANNMWRFASGITTHMRLEQILNSVDSDLYFFGKKVHSFFRLRLNQRSC